MTDKEITELNLKSATYYGAQLQMNHFTEELELSAEQTAKLTTLGEEYDKMIRSFREADLPPEEFAEYVVAKAEECKARLKERWG